MSHQVEQNQLTGEHSFFTVKAKAWWTDKYVLQEAPKTAEEALKAAKADFEVVKAPVTLHMEGHNKNIVVPNSFGLIRTDTNTPLGVVGSAYKVIQNREAFSFFDPIIGSGEATYETAGVLGKGERAFVTAKLQDAYSIRVNGKADDIEKYLVFFNPHTGRHTAMALITPVRVVCNNTLQMAFKQTEQVIAIKHVGDIEAQMKEAQTILRISEKRFKESKEMFQHLAKIKINDTQLREYLDKIFVARQKVDNTKAKSKAAAQQIVVSARMAKIREEAYRYAQEGAGQEMALGTAWGAYNAVTGYLQNVKDYRNEETRFTRNVLKTRVQRKALKMALELS